MSYATSSYANGAKVKAVAGTRMTLTGGHPDSGRSGEYIGTRKIFNAELPIPQVKLDKLPGAKAKAVFVLRPDYWKLEA